MNRVPCLWGCSFVALATFVFTTPALAGPNTSGLPLPSTLPLEEYEAKLYRFLDEKRYIDLGWKADQSVRDSGPFINGSSFGTHPAVRVFYSPGVYDWLKAGRSPNGIPDGAMIIKEMYDPPAARHTAKSTAQLRETVDHWTIMVKDSAGSKDGWFWSEYETGQAPDGNAYPFNYPLSGFGQYCLRCHASVERNMEFTFASLRNIEGEAADPIIFRVDDSWATADIKEIERLAAHPSAEETPDYNTQARSKPVTAPNPEFLRVFDALSPVKPSEIRSIPPVTWDHVVPGPGGPEQFMTSDNCLSCHDGQDTALGHNMTLVGDDRVNLSPYGEWQWSMMGLAGRDPIFFAQMESEIALQPGHGDEFQDLCFRCHGVMGQRQLHIDHAKDPRRYPRAAFSREIMMETFEPGTSDHRYGALARDGISCMVCHQIVDDGKPFAETVTGLFDISAPVNGASKVYGPFDDVVAHPMENALGTTPVYNEYTTSSRLCGSCHTIFLPVFNKAGELVDHDYEQTTYLEWLNSDFRTELGIGADPQSCQDCHMPDEYHGRKLAFRIANIQDQTYPEADHLASVQDITLPIREGYRRHTLHGINIFGLEMFNQFDNILGVRKTDYMTGFSDGLSQSIANADLMAKNKTATLEITDSRLQGDTLRAVVQVTNLAGHRLPSGVGFRRAFIEFLVIDANNTVVWASGRTNSLGIIVDAEGKHLPSEFREQVDSGGAMEQAYQPHHETIRRQDQVQIYEELVKSPEGEFTTSFVAQYETVKDNRLLPKGWTAEGPPGFAPPRDKRHDKQWDFPEATMPKGKGVLADRRFQDGTGSDEITYLVDLSGSVVEQIKKDHTVTVTATLYYQAIPPSYLRDRFQSAQGDSGKRLHYLTSHLNLAGTAIEGWKLLIDSDSAVVD